MNGIDSARCDGIPVQKSEVGFSNAERGIKIKRRRGTLLPISKEMPYWNFPPVHSTGKWYESRCEIRWQEISLSIIFLCEVVTYKVKKIVCGRIHFSLGLSFPFLWERKGMKNYSPNSLKQITYDFAFWQFFV